MMRGQKVDLQLIDCGCRPTPLTLLDYGSDIEADKLASDSENDKKLNKAEKGGQKSTPKKYSEY